MFKTSLISLLLAAAPLTAMAATLSEPKETLSAFYAALVAGDKAKAVALMSPDVAIYESGYVEASRDEYAHHHLGEDMAFAKTSTRKVLKHTERLEGNLAIIWEETETTGTARGKLMRALGTETVVLEKKGNQWLIAHIHWSSRKNK